MDNDDTFESKPSVYIHANCIERVVRLGLNYSER